jgi:hypothetical protein
MNNSEFWTLINSLSNKNTVPIENRIEQLEKELNSLSAENILLFHEHFEAKICELYTNNLKEAFFLVSDGYSDDSFWDFRTGIVAAGSELFTSVKENPENLAELSDNEIDNLYAEGFQYIAGKVYQEKTKGKELPAFICNNRLEKFQIDEEMIEKHYPKLAKRFY